MKRLRGLNGLSAALVAAGLLVALPAVVSNRALDDWPQWRGPNRDGRSAETGLLKDWPAGGPRLAWRATGAGEGYSSFATSQGRLFTLGARGGTEYVIAFDAASGKRLWETAHGTRFSNDRGDGPRATPTIEGDRVYAFGASGDLSVLDAASGKVYWTVNVLKQYPRIEHPVGAERISARPRGSHSGQRRWDDRRAQEDRRQVDLGEPGRRGRLLVGRGASGRHDQRGDLLHEPRVLGVDVNTGRRLWTYGQVANDVANIATPIVRGNRVFVSSDYGTGSALLELTASGNDVNATRGVLHAPDEEPPRDVDPGRRASLRLRQRDPHGHEVRHRRGRLAEPKRREGFPDVCRRSAVSVQRRRQLSGWPRPRRPATASTAASSSRRAGSPPGATRSSREASYS